VATRQWSELSGRQRAAVLFVGTVQLALAATAWRDFAKRPASAVNGRKGLWATIIAVNFAGPLAYFRWGRRR
jgi:phospholipase D-like protein